MGILTNNLLIGKEGWDVSLGGRQISKGAAANECE